MTDKVVVLSTCSSSDEADRIATGLLERRLAACVTVIPGARSHYRWKGTLEKAEEFVLIIKSSRALFDPLRADLERMHSYEVPEVVAIPIIDGSAAYLDWLAIELAQE